ncbi:hypothetical protein ACFVUH_08455 [Kitasatospora sp. NPDC058032]|uniref:hypothetical protein n=1 Tax=Kitasatospora sp. NPDC058032 TaxID=3346307 RepID=UPI0036DE45D3
MSLTTALSTASPGTTETGKIAAWAIRRLGDHLHDSESPAASATALEAVETALYEVEEALRLAAENAAADDGAPARFVAGQLSSSALDAVRLRTRLEAVAVRLRGYGDDFPAPDTEPARRNAARAESAVLAIAAAQQTPATATGFERTADPGRVARSLR